MAMNGFMIKGEPITIGRSISKNRRIKVLKNYPSSRIQNDSKVCEKLASKLDEQCKITDNPLYSHKYASHQQKFDTFLIYLRKVHAYDYFTSTSYINERTLCLKLGIAYLRMEAEYQEKEDFETVFKKIEQAAEVRVERSGDLPDHMKVLREEIIKMILKVISESEKIPEDMVMEKTKAWECFYCKKKFR